MKKERSRCYQDNLVKLAVEVLDENIDPKFGRNRHLKKLKIHEDRKGKYYRSFHNIATYLIELRGESKNDFKSLLIDYYTEIYKRFKSFGRMPSLINFSPSVSNKIRFEEFIYNFTVENDEEYWIKEIPDPPEIINVPIIPEDDDFIPSFIEV